MPHLEKPEDATAILQGRLQQLQERNALLSKMLEDAVESLRSVKLTSKESADEAEQNLNISLAKIQFVSVYLSDPDIPIPKEEKMREEQAPMSETTPPPEQTATVAAQIPTTGGDEESSKKEAPPVTKRRVDDRTNKIPSRPSLMDSSFSFMLGENRHRSSFVSSVAALPEQRRGSESKGGATQASTEVKTQQDRKGPEIEGDGFTLTKLEGGRRG
jgi:TBC1 domain family protein 5